MKISTTALLILVQLVCLPEVWSGEDTLGSPLATDAAEKENILRGGPEASPLAAVPESEQRFKELLTNSPFTRSLNLSETLILTGIAEIEGESVATVLNKESKETYVVSTNANAQGWRMIGVEGDKSDLERVTAKIAVSGGEIVAVRFDEAQLKPGEGRPAAGSNPGSGQRPGGSGGGPPGGMADPRTIMSRLSEQQRSQLFSRMKQMREQNPNMTPDQMRSQMSQALQRLGGQGGSQPGTGGGRPGQGGTGQQGLSGSRTGGAPPGGGGRSPSGTGSGGRPSGGMSGGRSGGGRPGGGRN